MDAFRQITAAAPEELTVWLDLLHFPGSDPMVAVDATYLGGQDAARDLLAPLDRLARPLSDSRRVMRVSELGGITAEPTDPGPGLSRAELLTELDDAAAKTLLTDPIAPLLSVQVRQLGGAFARPSDSPQGPLTEPYALYLFGIPAARAPPRPSPPGSAASPRPCPSAGASRSPSSTPPRRRPTPSLPPPWRGCARSSGTMTRTTSCARTFPWAAEGDRPRLGDDRRRAVRDPR
ncbi:hypothetical protein ACFQ0B_39050 [Nonomuraea thailandensis]